jgi:hypothetical protein
LPARIPVGSTLVNGLAYVMEDAALLLETYADLCLRVAANLRVVLTVGIVSGRAVDTRLHSVHPAIPIAVVVRHASNVLMQRAYTQWTVPVCGAQGFGCSALPSAVHILLALLGGVVTASPAFAGAFAPAGPVLTTIRIVLAGATVIQTPCTRTQRPPPVCADRGLVTGPVETRLQGAAGPALIRIVRYTNARIAVWIPRIFTRRFRRRFRFTTRLNRIK